MKRLMKLIVRSFLLPAPVLGCVLCLWCVCQATVVLGQTVYRVPRTVTFGGVQVSLDEEARQTVQKDVNMLVSSRRALDIKLDRMVQYLPIVEGILVEEDVPADFKYLVVQESSLMPDAVSTSNAVGFWQFKKETAGDFGLRVDTDVDERKSIHASTRAAALYLKKNNQILNNWISSLLSFRLGLGGMRNLVPREWAYATDIKVDGKTDWYVLRSLAHKLVFESELADFKPNAPLILAEYRYSGGKTISQMAQELGVEEVDLRQFNRWLSSDRVPDDKEYVTIVPVKREQLEGMKKRIASLTGRTDFIKDDFGFPLLKRLTPSVKNKNLPIYYEINGKRGIMAQEGDTPAGLAQKAKLSFEKFMSYNDLKPQDRLTPGEVYYLVKKSRKAPVLYHTVRNDETLWRISQLYGIRLKSLMKYNRLSQVTKLQPGRVMYLRKKRPKNKPIEYIKLPTENAKPAEPKTAPATPSRNDTKPATTPPQETPVTPAIEDTKVPKSAEESPASSPTAGDKSNKALYPNAKPTTHTVEAGQTYYSIARQYNVSVQELYAWNNISEAVPLKTGSKLLIKYSSRRDTAPNSETIIEHEVQKGDTLFNISKRYEVSPEQIKEWNGMTDSNISIGQKLNIKKKN